jgi:hypothetical protein
MAKLSFPTSTEIKGPLLIDPTQLEVLDQIIDRHLERIREYRNNVVNEQASKEAREGVSEGLMKEDQVASYEAKCKRELLSTYRFGETRSFSLYLTRGREIQAHRFSEAASQPVGDQETALGFSSYLKVGEVEAKIRLRSSRSEGISIDVEPNHVEVAQELFGALSNWASDIEAPKWQQRWLEFKELAVVVLSLVLIFGFILVPLLNWGGAGKSASTAEARKLLASGINSSNEQRAITLLLAIASDYDPGVPAPSLGTRYWGYLLLSFVVLLIGSSCPSVSIGLWKGKRRLKARRWWIRTVAVAIPTIFVSSLLVPWLLHWLRLRPPSP